LKQIVNKRRKSLHFKNISRGNMPYIQNNPSRPLRLVAHGLQIVKWALTHPDALFHPELYYSHIELSLTTNCTLRCRGCCHFTPCFEKEAYTPASQIIEDCRRLLNGIQWVDIFRVLGGEPLLYPELTRVVEFLLQSPKIGFVEIVTNGTLAPKKELLALFPHKRLNILISNYGALSSHIGDFAAVPPTNLTVLPTDQTWLDHGDLTFRNRSEPALRKQYSCCDKDKAVLTDGKLFNCACSAFGSRLGAFSLAPDEYIDLREINDPQKLTARLLRQRRLGYYTACNYCNRGTDRLVSIPPALQLEKDEILKLY